MDLVVAQRVVEGLGERSIANCVADVAGVAGFDAEDGSSSCQVCLGHDIGGRTNVGADTNTCRRGQYRRSG